MEKIKNLIIEAKTRIITALVLLFIVGLVVVIDSYFLTWAVLGLVYLIAFYESCKLFGIVEINLYALAILLWIICGFTPTPILIVFVVLMVLVSTMLQKQNVQLKLLIPFIYPTISMVLLLTLYSYFGMFSLVWLILIVASTDIGAYVVGKFIGKTKFSTISPNKTWEGVLGGIAIGSIVGIISGTAHFSFWVALTISLATSAASIWGDLFESYLKREANLKDSGSIFPGHGGVLDRVDGYLFGVVVMLALLEGLI